MHKSRPMVSPFFVSFYIFHSMYMQAKLISHTLKFSFLRNKYERYHWTRRHMLTYLLTYVITFVFFLLYYKYRSGRQGFCKFLLQQRIVCVCCFMIMLPNNCMTFSVNMIMFVQRTSLRTESMMHSLQSNSNLQLCLVTLLLVKFCLTLLIDC